MPRMTIEQRLTRLLATVFFFSGFASLVYQVVWQRILTQHYGVGSVSTTLIVGIYMAGLGIGGLAGGLLVERIARRVALYFWVELGIGLFGLISLPFLGWLGQATAGSPRLLSAFFMFLFLFVPTFLMGTTLPVLTKIFSRFRADFFQTVSYLYFINTIGAAAGALATSYLLISFLMLDGAVLVAVCIDFLLAFLVYRAGRLVERLPDAPAVDPRDVVFPVGGGLGRWAYLLVFVTGFIALGYEIIWYRMISVLVKDSPYAFSTILAVYLLGVALGSLWANRLLQRRPRINRKRLYFLFQAGIGLYVLLGYTAYALLTRYTAFGEWTRLSFDTNLHPHPGLLLALPKHLPEVPVLFSWLDMFLWPLLFLFVPTFLMGAGFPLVSSLALSQIGAEGRTVGTVYFFNVLGNVFGSVLTGFVILPALGSEPTLLVFGLIGLLGLLAAGGRRWFPMRAAVVVGAAVVGLVFFPHRGDLYRLFHPVMPQLQEIVGEGVDGVVVTYHNNGPTVDYMNGIPHGYYGTEWYYAWVIDGISFAPDLDDILVIGFGSGTFPAVLRELEGVQSITVVELSGTLMDNHKGIPFYEEMLSDPRIELIIDDGRQYLMRTERTFDAILMDPLPATTSHANNLHSSAFFELARSRLKPGGVVLLGGVSTHTVVAKTMAAVFPYVRVYDGYLIGSDAPMAQYNERREAIIAKLEEPKKTLITDYLGRTYLGDQQMLLEQAARYPINEAWAPHTEYYLGLAVQERLHLLP